MSRKRIVLLNYGAGNMASIRNALQYLEIDFVEISENNLVEENDDAYILPGVGSFYKASLDIRNRGFIKMIKKNPRLIGICLGMQLLFSEGAEGGVSEGLGLIPGKVLSLSEHRLYRTGIRLPHVGWNNLVIEDEHTERFEPLTIDSDVYFVHSFMAFGVPKENLIATATFSGISIPSVVAKDKVIGFQFHPEKSGYSGLQMLKHAIEFIAN